MPTMLLGCQISIKKQPHGAHIPSFRAVFSEDVRNAWLYDGSAALVSKAGLSEPDGNCRTRLLDVDLRLSKGLTRPLDEAMRRLTVSRRLAGKGARRN